MSKALVTVATVTGFNLGTDKVNIKDVRAESAGAIDIIDAQGVSHTLTAFAAEKLDLQGKIQIVATTVPIVHIYL